MKIESHKECRDALLTASRILWQRITQGHFLSPEEVRAAVGAHKAIEKAVFFLDGPLSQAHFEWPDQEGKEEDRDARAQGEPRSSKPQGKSPRLPL